MAVDGLEDVGGGEFDEIMYQLIEQKLQVPLNLSHKAALRAEAEKIKKDLTFDTYADAEVLYNNEYLTVRVTREEFETASRELLMRTIEATKKCLKDIPIRSRRQLS